MEEKQSNTGTKRKDRNSPENPLKDEVLAKKVKPANYLTSESDEDFDNRNRTPSGTVIPKISNIRDYFSPSSKKESKQVKKSNSSKPANRDRHCARETLNSTSSKGAKPTTPTIKVSGVKKSLKRSSVNKNSGEHKQTVKKGTSSDSDNEVFHTPTVTPSTSELNISSPDQETLYAIASVLQSRQEELKSEPYESFKKRVEMQNMQNSQEGQPETSAPTEMTDMETEISNTATPEIQVMEENEVDEETMTLSLVYQMFKDLKKDFADLKGGLTQVKKECAEEAAAAAAAAASDTVQEECTDKLNKVTAELKHCQLKNEILSDICNSMHGELADLTQKLENLEINSTKRMVIMSGRQLQSSKKDDGIEELETFFKNKLDIEVMIDDYFFLGQSIVIELQCMADKRAVMSSKHLLNNLQAKIYINDYIPIATSEKRRREKQIIRDLEEVAKAEKTEIKVEYTKAGLTVQGEPYRKRVSPPTPRELMQLSVEELEEILQTRMRKGNVVVSEGSRFTAYYADAQTHQQIRRMYMKLKLTKTTAKHIVCAYIIPGAIHTSRDFHDDGEPGSGRVLLQLMEEQQMTNKVLFVVRRYGGVKLGALRYECYRRAALSAVQDDLNASSSSTAGAAQTEISVTNTTQKTFSRGGMRGRRGNRERPPAAPYTSRLSQPRAPPQQHYSQRANTNFPPHQQRGGGHSDRGARSSTQRGRRDNRYERLIQSSSPKNNTEYSFSNPLNRFRQSDWNENSMLN